MKFSILSPNLKTALAAVKPAVTSKPVIPALSFARFEADGDTLEIAASNFEKTIIATVAARVETKGAVCVPAATIADLSACWDGEAIRAELNPRTLALEVSSGASHARIKCLDETEYPPLTSRASGWKPAARLTVSTDDFKRAIRRVIFSASSDQARPALTGVMLEVETSGKLSLRAADGFRLAMDRVDASSISLPEGRTSIGVLIPAKSLADVLHMMGETVDIGIDASYADFLSGEIELIAQAISVEYPDFSQIIPKSPDVSWEVEVNMLRVALSRARIFKGGSGALRIRVDFANGQMIIKTENDETGENTEVIPITSARSKGKHAVACNIDYLSQAIANVEGMIRFEQQRESAPVVITAKNAPDWKALIMPLNLNEEPDATDVAAAAAEEAREITADDLNSDAA